MQAFHVLIAFCVAAALGIGMCKLVHKNKLWSAFNCCVKVKFFKGDTVIFNRFIWQDFKPLYKCGCLRTGVRLHIACNNVHAAFLCVVCGFQHSIGFSHACRIAEKYFQLSSVNVFFFSVYGFKYFIVRSLEILHNLHLNYIISDFYEAFKM